MYVNTWPFLAFKHALKLSILLTGYNTKFHNVKENQNCLHRDITQRQKENHDYAKKDNGTLPTGKKSKNTLFLYASSACFLPLPVISSNKFQLNQEQDRSLYFEIH